MVVFDCLMYKSEFKSFIHSFILKSLLNLYCAAQHYPISSSVLSLVLGIELGALHDLGEHSPLNSILNPLLPF